MTSSRYIFFVLLVISLSCAGKGIDDKENSLLLLSQKADSALLFCQQKNMNTDYCILVNMGIHSGKKRFFLWDFEKDSIAASSLCAHGYGMESTETTPVFSNISGSYCTSLGKYKIGIRSYSKWGINVHYKMHGLEDSNDKAYDRIIVLHSHNPISSDEIYPFHLPLGYSQGCPVIDNQTMKQLDKLFQTIDKPMLLWIYYE